MDTITFKANFKYCERVVNGNIYYSLHSIINLIESRLVHTSIDEDTLNYIIDSLKDDVKMIEGYSRILYIPFGEVSAFTELNSLYNGVIHRDDILLDVYALYIVSDYISINNYISIDIINNIKYTIVDNTHLSVDSLESFKATLKINTDKLHRVKSYIQFKINKTMVDNHLLRVLNGRVLSQATNTIDRYILGDLESEIKKKLCIDQNDTLYNHCNEIILTILAYDYNLIYNHIRYKTGLASIRKEVINMTQNREIITVPMECLYSNTFSTINNELDSVMYNLRLQRKFQ